MVVLTFLAFMAAYMEIKTFNEFKDEPTLFEWIAVAICAVGVFLFNSFERKKRKVCMTED